MKLQIEKFEIEITPEDQKTIAEFLAQREELMLQYAQEDTTAHRQTVVGLLPVLIQILEKIWSGGTKYDPIDPPPMPEPAAAPSEEDGVSDDDDEAIE